MKLKRAVYKKNRSNVIWGIVSLLIVLLCMLVICVNIINTALENSERLKVSEFAQISAKEISKNLSSELSLLQNISEIFSKNNVAPQDIQKLLKSENYGYDIVEFIDNFESKTKYDDFLLLNSALDVINTKTSKIINVCVNTDTNEQILFYIVPYSFQKKVVGAICVGHTNNSNIAVGAALVMNDTEIANYIIDSKGNIILSADNPKFNFENTWQNIFFLNFNSQSEMEKIKYYLERGTNSNGIVTFNNTDYIVSMEPIGINDWQIMTALPQKSIAFSGNTVSEKTAIFAISIMVMIIVLYTVVLLTRQNRVKHISKLAFTDPVSNCYNSNYFEIKGARILEDMEEQYAIAIFDIYRFKTFNDLFGYAVGDLLLKHISEILENSVTENELFARTGPDQFSVLFEYTDKTSIKKRISDILFRIKDFFPDIFETTVYHDILIDVGVYVIEEHISQIDQCTDRARVAMDNANKIGQINFFTEKMRKDMLKDKELERYMAEALDFGEFVPYYQLKYDIFSNKPIGCEALARWLNPNKGVIYPNEFIPLFERNGFIVKLDMFIFRRVCYDMVSIMAKGYKMVPVSVNFSKLHLKNPNFAKTLYEITKEFEIDPSLIEIETNENVVTGNEDLFKKVLFELQTYGFKIAIDGFGSGYSSLGILESLPINIIKLDRSFVVNLENSPRALAVIKSVVHLANELGIMFFAEGVENKEQIKLLKDIGCNNVQGYYYCLPKDAKGLEKIYGEEGKTWLIS